MQSIDHWPVPENFSLGLKATGDDRHNGLVEIEPFGWNVLRKVPVRGRIGRRCEGDPGR